MKRLFTGIWEAPGSTVAAALMAALTAAQMNEELVLAPGWRVTLGAVAAFLALFSGRRR